MRVSAPFTSCWVCWAPKRAVTRLWYCSKYSNCSYILIMFSWKMHHFKSYHFQLILEFVSSFSIRIHYCMPVKVGIWYKWGLIYTCIFFYWFKKKIFGILNCDRIGEMVKESHLQTEFQCHWGSQFQLKQNWHQQVASVQLARDLGKAVWVPSQVVDLYSTCKMLGLTKNMSDNYVHNIERYLSAKI